MGKTFRDRVKAANLELKRDIERMDIKKRVTFHQGTTMHGRYGREAIKQDRRNTKLALKREIW